ncbi:NADH dehydrogenase [ubiquinone] 1 alpha subcomplex assembly factor 3 isoform X2 [Manis pentadactyla]|uniref:NADH dehydrogenase [ubiquinone] 1 alpha subcomplex assembly factor 3 isoform X2 n=1 Tax=Manis pentadactyla TaxID=143292 RepID=UPI00255CE892|nr:NADH dehydrogenase [ubiquinone] 1 alpha subcomplex assembly factor 3 isoform X2 [Manis pentadactyla]
MVAASLLRCLPRARAAPAQLLRAPRRGHRLTPADDELYQRTRISLLQRESPHAVYIDSYSSRGFTVNGNRVLGPCALLPPSVVQWNVGSHQEITEESLSLFWMLEPPRLLWWALVTGPNGCRPGCCEPCGSAASLWRCRTRPMPVPLSTSCVMKGE